MNSVVKKAIIPIAGIGSRFLPATTIVSKELFPIVDRPIMLYILDEVISAGIEEVVFVTGPGKQDILQLFTPSSRLEESLEKNGQLHLIQDIYNAREKLKFHTVLQEEPLGLGHAVLTGKKHIGDSPFAVLLADELIFTPKDETPILKALVSSYNDSQVSTVSLMKVALEDVNKYGIASGINKNKVEFEIQKLVEKPSSEDTPSQWALPGRYVFSSDLFSELENIKPGKNNEYQLTDAMHNLAQKQPLLGIKMESLNNFRYDAGNQLGYLIANIEYALRNKRISESVKDYLIQLTKNFGN